MKKPATIFAAFALGLAVAAGGASAAYAFQDAAAELRATGTVGEQADGYLGTVGSASAEVRAKVDQINIQRRAAYTRLAAERGVTIEEAARATACQLFATRVQPGQYYRLPDGVWRQRNGNEPVPRPAYCG